MKRLRQRQAMLSESLESETLAMMSVGERRWTVPWAMWVDAERQCWLYSHYSAHMGPGGTVQMCVIRSEDGYEVDVSRCRDHGWVTQNRPTYVGCEGVEWIPVVVIRGAV